MSFFIKLTKTSVSFGDIPDLNFYSVEFHLKGVKKVQDAFTEQFPELAAYLQPTPGISIVRYTIPQHEVIKFTECAKCKKRDITTGYFFCRPCNLCYCKFCGWTGLSWDDEFGIPPHSHNMYFVNTGNPKYFKSLSVMKEEDFNESKNPKHKTICSSCQIVEFDRLRFKCCICDDCNICGECFEKIKDSTNLPNGLKLKECDPKSHLYIGIYYDNVF